MSHSKLKRIAIIGRPGSGKSTFAISLSKQLQLPVFHLDKIFFTDHWKERNRTEFLEQHCQWIDQPGWIIDGNSLTSLELRYAKADLVIIFLLPKWKYLLRIIQRRFQPKNPAIDDRASNCPEKVSLKLLHYTWTFERHLFPILNALKEKYPSTSLIIITSDHQKKHVISEFITFIYLTC